MDRDYGILNYVMYYIIDIYVVYYLFFIMLYYYVFEVIEVIKLILGKYYQMDRIFVFLVLW